MNYGEVLGFAVKAKDLFIFLLRAKYLFILLRVTKALFNLLRAAKEMCDVRMMSHRILSVASCGDDSLADFNDVYFIRF